MISISNLSKDFGEIKVLKNINLNIKPFEKVAIIGPSGSGKTTLLRCIKKLEKKFHGKIDVETGLKSVGFVFQSFNLFPHLTVEENLSYAPLKVSRIAKQKVKEKVNEISDALSIRYKLNNYPKDLSGGQKQRVAIARVLMMDPKIILFDEPTSALDPEVILDLVNVISMLKNQTVVVVTHHIAFAKKIADRIIFMDQGEIIEDLKVEELHMTKSFRVKTFIETSLC